MCASASALASGSMSLARSNSRVGVARTLGMGEPGVPAKACVGSVAVAEQHAIFERTVTRNLAHMDARTRGEVDKHQIAPNRPEVPCFELAPALAPGVDRRLVHRFDPASADACELRRDDRREQQRDGQHLLDPPLTAFLNAGGGKALMLALQRQVIETLVDDQPGKEADICASAVERRRRCRQCKLALSVRLISGRTYLRMT